MKKYFTHDGTNQHGPFSVADLQTQKISRQTLVWFDGMSDWTKAEEIEELTEVFKSVPPPVHIQSAPKQQVQTNSSQQYQGNIHPNSKPKSKIGIQVFSIISIVVSSLTATWGTLITVAALDSYSYSQISKALSVVGIALIAIGIFYLIYSIVVLISTRRN
jgi:hypothetical protein